MWAEANPQERDQSTRVAEQILALRDICFLQMDPAPHLLAQWQGPV